MRSTGVFRYWVCNTPSILQKKHWQGQYEILSVMSQGTFGTLEYMSDVGGDCYHKSRQVTTALPKGI